MDRQYDQAYPVETIEMRPRRQKTPEQVISQWKRGGGRMSHKAGDVKYKRDFERIAAQKIAEEMDQDSQKFVTLEQINEWFRDNASDILNEAKEEKDYDEVVVQRDTTYQDLAKAYMDLDKKKKRLEKEDVREEKLFQAKTKARKKHDSTKKVNARDVTETEWMKYWNEVQKPLEKSIRDHKKAEKDYNDAKKEFADAKRRVEELQSIAEGKKIIEKIEGIDVASAIVGLTLIYGLGVQGGQKLDFWYIGLLAAVIVVFVLLDKKYKGIFRDGFYGKHTGRKLTVTLPSFGLIDSAIVLLILLVIISDMLLKKREWEWTTIIATLFVIGALLVTRSRIVLVQGGIPRGPLNRLMNAVFLVALFTLGFYTASVRAEKMGAGGAFNSNAQNVVDGKMSTDIERFTVGGGPIQQRNLLLDSRWNPNDKLKSD